MYLPHLQISAHLGLGLALATVVAAAYPSQPAPIAFGMPTAANPRHPAAAPHALPADLVPAVMRALAEHSPPSWNAQAARGGALVFHNPVQRFSASFSSRGAQVQFGGSRHARLGMQLLAVRSGNVSYRVVAGAPSPEGARVEIARGRGLSEWYVNSPLGLEQGFTLAKPLAGGGSIALIFHLRGALTPNLNSRALEFHNAQGQTVLRYSGLLAYDAQHHILPARMKLKGRILELAVDARGARYPITIDPVIAAVSSITDTDPSSGELFGLSVALSADGNTALIGAPGVTTLAPYVTDAGDVFVFTRSNGAWSLTAILFDPAATNYDGFGQSVSLSADGTRALIGTNAGCPNCGTSGTGAAYLFIQSNGTWPSSPTSTFSDPAAQSGDYFGYSVALSGDGNTALIGAFDTNFYNPNISQVGVAWVFTESGGSWAANPSAVAGLASNPMTAGALVGYNVALSYYGTSALVGAPGTNIGGNSSVGAAYLFLRPSSGWSGTPSVSQTFYDPNVRANGNLGASVAITPDGSEVLIGDPGTHSGVPGVGAAYLFTQSSGTWSGFPTASFSDGGGLTDDFGMSVALSGDGVLALIGAPYANSSGQSASGGVYAFAEANGAWPATPTFGLGDPAAAAGDLFGSSVALGGSGVGTGVTGLAGAFSTTVSNQVGAGKVYVLGPSADLQLDLASSPASATVGESVSYLFTVTNLDSQITADSLTLSDTLPAGMSFVSVNAAGGTCSNNNGTVNCTLAQLAPAATWQPSITVKATMSGSIVNSGTVTATQFDPNTANSTQAVTTKVTTIPPTVTGGSVTDNENIPVNGTLMGSNPCSCGTPVFAVVTQPAHGTVKLTNAATGAFAFTPANNFTGNDSFTFDLGNGLSTSNTATESVTVNAVNGGGGGGSGGGSSGASSGGGGLGALCLLFLGLLLWQRRKRLTMSFAALSLIPLCAAQAYASPPAIKNPCKLLTHAEVSAALGKSFSSGKLTNTGAGPRCRFFTASQEEVFIDVVDPALFDACAHSADAVLTGIRYKVLWQHTPYQSYLYILKDGNLVAVGLPRRLTAPTPAVEKLAALVAGRM